MTKPSVGMPGFVVLGAQKSASTFLQDRLDLHPDIEIAAGESRHFEDPHFQSGAVASLPDLFRSRHALRGIKRPDYLGKPEVAARLHAALPDARLFVVLREPVARAVSAYYHYVRLGFLPLLPLDDAFRSILDGGLDTYPKAAEVLSYGMYGEHITRYLQLFPAEHLMIVDQVRLVGEPEVSLRDAFEFLDVDAGFVPDTASLVSNRGVYSPMRLRWLRSKNHLTYTYTPTLSQREPRRPGPAGWLWNATVVGVDRVVLSRFDRSPTPRLSEQMQARVKERYAADGEALDAILNTRGQTMPWRA